MNTQGKARARLLIVDDEENIQNMLSRHFRLKGYEVMTASDGAEALDIIEKEKIEVVVSDIMTPKMNGIELLQEIKKSYPIIHVIIITGYTTVANLLSALQYGADTCIFKPMNDMNELEDAVENAVKHLRRWQRKLRELKAMQG